uniref:Uncharacterized protein n=1 Tax=Kalanchoe fedtschenkoi TaxID=63787 RepID=A0A7N0UFR3_KALFE
MSAQGGVSIARNRNGDRFYSPPAVRKQRQQMLLQQQQREQQQQQQQRQHDDKKEKGMSSSLDSEKLSDDSLSTTTSSSRADSGCSISRQSVDCATNLDRFLQNTTPVVAAHYLSKTSVRGRRSRVVDSPPYFILDELWESFKEWSAYGAGVPILLNDSESVVQYYVPFLSAIQLFVDPSRPSSGLRRPGEDSDIGSSRETSSEGSCDRDAERGDINHNNRSRGLQNVTENDIRSFNRLSIKNKTSIDASSSDGQIQNTPGTVAFEFFERESPFVREPLANKISVLASRFPGLKTYRSCDLLPQSWLSVAWYPIYRIPTGPTLQNVDACFLTYHSLHTPLSSKDVATSQVQQSRVNEVHHPNTLAELSLPTFALASYRFKASVWESDCQKEQLLLHAASNWLKLRQAEHPDYGFFMTNYIYPLLR